MGHRPGRVEAGEPRPGRCRRADAAADDRGVVEDVGDVGMDVAGAERDDRLRGCDLDALAGGGRPAGRLGEHPEQGGLVQAELEVAGADPEDDLLGRDDVAVVECLDRYLGRIATGRGRDR